jgi:hypothetical protein
MQQASETMQNYSNNPSLLRQIVDEVDLMDDIRKQRLLMYLKKDKILASVKKLDEMLLGLNVKLTDDEITDMVSEDRKANYDKQNRY